VTGGAPTQRGSARGGASGRRGGGGGPAAGEEGGTAGQGVAAGRGVAAGSTGHPEAAGGAPGPVGTPAGGLGWDGQVEGGGGGRADSGGSVGAAGCTTKPAEGPGGPDDAGAESDRPIVWRPMRRARPASTAVGPASRIPSIQVPEDELRSSTPTLAPGRPVIRAWTGATESSSTTMWQLESRPTVRTAPSSRRCVDTAPPLLPRTVSHIQCALHDRPPDSTGLSVGGGRTLRCWGGPATFQLSGAVRRVGSTS
jgi:hypothetical protein